MFYKEPPEFVVKMPQTRRTIDTHRYWSIELGLAAGRQADRENIASPPHPPAERAGPSTTARAQQLHDEIKRAFPDDLSNWHGNGPKTAILDVTHELLIEHILDVKGIGWVVRAGIKQFDDINTPAALERIAMHKTGLAEATLGHQLQVGIEVWC